GVQCAQSPQQTPRGIQRRGGRSLQEGKLTDVADSKSVESQNYTGEVQALNFWRLMVWTGIEVLTGVQAQAPPRPGSARTSGPLNGGGFADFGKVGGGRAGRGRLGADSSQPAVDHRRESLDCHGGLGDVGGKDQFPAGRRPNGSVLLIGGQLAVQGVKL